MKNTIFYIRERKKLKRKNTHGGTRTRNLQIRSLTPYPIRLREPILKFKFLLAWLVWLLTKFCHVMKWKYNY